MLTVGKLLGWILAIIFVAGLAGLSYVAYKYYEARSYAQKEGARDISSPGALLAVFQGAPPIVCEVRAVSFNVPYVSTIYVWNNQVRIESHYPAVDTRTHQKLDQSGLYVWTDEGLDVLQVPLDGRWSADTPDPTRVFTDGSCAPWWSPDEKLFDLPPAARVHTLR